MGAKVAAMHSAISKAWECEARGQGQWHEWL